MLLWQRVVLCMRKGAWAHEQSTVTDAEVGGFRNGSVKGLHKVETGGGSRKQTVKGR